MLTHHLTNDHESVELLREEMGAPGSELADISKVRQAF